MTFEQDPGMRRLILKADEVIEHGWKALVFARKSKHVHIIEKEIFFAGAAFMFDVMLNSMSQEREPTSEDIAVLEKIRYELDRFNTGFTAKITGAPSR